MARTIITKKKIVALIISFLILLFLFLTATRYFHLATSRWVNNHFVTTEITKMERTDNPDVYKADVALKIYSKKWLWIIGVPCFSTTLLQGTEKPEEMNNWSNIEMNEWEITLQNGSEVVRFKHHCG